ncbi:LolA family protein [Subtercola sp. YIM 133946]|uniref:LolA family protein n=1 Tax=Subtercola sp. YIM 133946 TaxID=3118909 RepID=UPI002F95395D
MSANNWKRWIPAAVIPVVIAGAAIAVPLSANATASLPTKTPQEVLAMIGNSTVTAFSGTVEQSANLGLPELPAGVSSSSLGASGGSSDPSATATPGSGSGSGSTADATSAVSSALELLTGTHTARVYVDGATSQRVQVLDQMAETDVVRNGSDVWLYDSSKQTAVHSTLPAHDADGSGSSDSTTTIQTPEQLAQKFLDDVDPSTDVSVGGDVTVAGRSAYDLILTPQATDTLVGAVSIAVDSETGLPLQVSVTARGAADTAFSTGFTDLTLATPSADLFTFTPPAGTTVTEKAAPADGSAPGANTGPADAAAGTKPIVTGTGWNAIVELPAGADSAALTSSPLLGELTTAVDGGHVLTTTLVTVFVTDDGRVYAGSVSADTLQAAAAAQ